MALGPNSTLSRCLWGDIGPKGVTQIHAIWDGPGSCHVPQHTICWVKLSQKATPTGLNSHGLCSNQLRATMDDFQGQDGAQTDKNTLTKTYVTIKMGGRDTHIRIVRGKPQLGPPTFPLALQLATRDQVRPVSSHFRSFEMRTRF